MRCQVSPCQHVQLLHGPGKEEEPSPTCTPVRGCKWKGCTGTSATQVVWDITSPRCLPTFYSTWQHTSDSTTAPHIISHSSAIATDQPCQRSHYYSPYTAQALFSTAMLYAIQRAVPDPEDLLFKALCSCSN